MDATSRLASPPAAFAFAVVVLSLSIAVQDNRDPYIDEAMLVSNFIQAPDWRLLEPMPLFEQAAPLGYVLLARLISRWADVGDLVVFRALSATAAVIAAVFIYKAASRMTAGWGASVAAVLALSSPQVLFHATSIKHYTFEYLACSLMIYVSIRVVQQPKIHSYGVFLIACVVSCMFSFTAAIPIGFCLFGIAVHQTYLHFFDGIRLPLSHHGPLLVSVFSAAMIIVGFYVVYTRPVTALQFAAYTDVYASYFLSVDKNVFENLNILKRVVGFSALSYFAPVSLTTAASEIGILNEFRFFSLCGFSVFLPTCLYFLHPKRIFLLAAFIGCVSLIVVLSLLHLTPIAFNRHFLFTIPLTALVMVIGTIDALDRVQRAMATRRLNILNTVRIALVVAVFGLYGGGALFSAQRLERQEISPLLAHVERTSPETPVWIYWVAQPAMRVMAPPALTQIGLLDPRSHQDGWTRKAEVRSSLNQRRRPNPEYVKDMQKALEGYHDVWLLFSHLTGMEDSLQHFLDAAGEVVGPCSEVMATSGASTALFRCTRGHPSLM